MTDFQRHEKNKSLIRAVEHLTAALAHLKAAAHEDKIFTLGLRLPPEKQFIDAINDCSHVYKQPGETPA